MKIAAKNMKIGIIEYKNILFNFYCYLPRCIPNITTNKTIF